ncbi:DNA polymerase III subunit alpha [Buchnera aphidicola (Pemphigus obesinymphae)]|uniref:DNA polymerase III subunit alpha n=1 Tax=Buchnera aphidicola TaxID=9 RepID=UPI002238A9F1|nr:DNA polymerase III subunit alpha [Buchnera aphidicola]MCW5196479.1 DNA polymerase III subunit alpha [Buchnera aphidicola (Pemphigus obesinymphae)]
MYEKRFIHLRVHSDYSLIDGLVKPELLIERAVNLGMPALALTDFSNFYGVIKFYKSAHEKGIKPIIGVDFKIDSEFLEGELSQITALASNNIGYKNLILLISHGYRYGYDNLVGVTIKKKWLLKYKEGLILLSGGCYGDVGKLLLRGNIKLANQCLSFYQKYFFDFYYLEIMRTGRINEEKYLNIILKLAIENSIPLVATNEVCFINQEDFEVHKIRVAINKSYRLDDVKFIHNYSCQQFMRDEKTMCELFSDIPESLINSVEIAKRCNVILNLGKSFLPNFYTGRISAEKFLIMKAKQGMEERLNFAFPEKNIRNQVRKNYDVRLESELSIINKMGFPSYFLIVMEFIQWAKDHDIPVGPGRGSGAGSLVAYALKITEIDPLSFDLLFERFLNPDRISLPDFDIDFCMDKRDKVIEHVSEIYGKEAVAQIITFGTLTAKAVIRDVGRVLGYPYGFVNRISKLIPLDLGITLNKALLNQTELLELYKSDVEVKRIIDISKKLEGVTRNVSKHAGGVVISSTKITDFSPLYCDEYGKNQVTQFDKNDVEYVGLVKFDFLGLRTLTVINLALKMINKNRVKKNKSKIDISLIPLDDIKTFKKLQESETTGVFQLESLGMKDLIKRLKPDSFEDIIALVALFRPGPLQSGMVDNFINRKHGKESIYYPDSKWQHPLLKKVLESTYGIILYQEQVMEIARVLASYTLSNADILRRAMAKKDPIEMSKQRAIFQEGSKKNGIDQKLSIKIFDLVENFAGYGFNKSHSVAYALISYQTLWLKTHYSTEFMAALMSADMDNIKKIVSLIDECKRMKLTVLSPSINYSKYYFYVNEKNEIVYGLGAIKGIGENSIYEIIRIRKKYGIFKQLLDLCIRTDSKKVTRRVIEKLIFSGSCDCFRLNRGILMNILNDNIKIANQYLISQSVKQQDLFGSILNDAKELNYINNFEINTWSKNTELSYEYEMLGTYLSGHPMHQYLDEIKYYMKGKTLKDICCFSILKKNIIVVGMVTNFIIKYTKNKNRIAFFMLDDSTKKLNVIVFNDILEKYEHFLKNNCIIVIYGYFNFDNFGNCYRFVARSFVDLCKYRDKKVAKVLVLLTKKQNNPVFLKFLKKVLESTDVGVVPVYFFYKNHDIKFNFPFSVNKYFLLSNNFLDELRLLVGLDQVKLKFFRH